MRRVVAVVFLAFGILAAPSRAESLIRDLKSSDPSGFRANNYDYLLGRLAERRGLATEATALYLGVVSRNSSLAQYAIWRLARIARSSGDLQLERQYLSRLSATATTLSLQQAARERLIQNYLDAGSFQAA